MSSQPKVPAPPSGKLYYIDNLRIAMTALVIFHHTAITYGAPGGWYMSDPVASTGIKIGLTWFVATNQSFFMGFFFLLSALFTESSYRNKGAARFLADRARRLGIPLLFYSFVLSPVLIYLVLKYQDRVPYSFTGFLRHFTGWINFGVLWFVAALLLFTGIYALTQFLFPGAGKTYAFPSRRRILAFATGVGAISFVVRIFFPVGWVLSPPGFQPAHFAQYIALFSIGIVATRSGWVSAFPVQNTGFWTRLSLALVLLGFPLLYGYKILTHVELTAFQGGPGIPSLLTSLWEQLTGFSIILALTGVAKSRANTNNTVTRKLGRAAFAVYIIHPLFVIGLALIALRIAVSPGVRGLVVAPLAVFFSFAAGLLIVRIPGVNRVV